MKTTIDVLEEAQTLANHAYEAMGTQMGAAMALYTALQATEVGLTSAHIKKELRGGWK